MEVPTDFAKRVAALSESTPHEAIANLLSALMPRVQSTVRPPTPVADQYVPRDKPIRYDYPSPSPNPMRKLRSPRTRRPRSAAYKVLSTYHNARRGTKRANHLNIVLRHTNTFDAIQEGAEPCDFKYAEEIGLITFNIGE